MSKIPKTWRLYDVKFHLVSEFKDGDVDIVVYKSWWKCSRKWNYEVKKKNLFIILMGFNHKKE